MTTCGAPARLFDDVAPELASVAAHLSHSTDEAENLIQATFLTAIERAERSGAHLSVTLWLLVLRPRDRGPLVATREMPRATTHAANAGTHAFALRSSELEPGYYRVINRVRDTTCLHRERWPLVLRDEYCLLESERICRVCKSSALRT